MESHESTADNMTIKFGDLTFKTTKRHVKQIGPHNTVVESDNRKAPDSDWTECPQVEES